MKFTRSVLNSVLMAAMLYTSSICAAWEASPLACPQCGAWTLTSSQPPGVLGEKLVVSAEWVSIPMCGEFRPTVSSSSVKAEDVDRHSYHVSLALQGEGRGSCAIKDGGSDSLKADIRIDVAYRREGGFGEFVIFEVATGRTVFAATGWNYERDNPCDTGSSLGSLACVNVGNAELQRRLFQSALLANADYRVGRVVRAAERACRNEGEGAGGSWPAVWRELCQSGLLSEKLDAFTAFHQCRLAKGKRCRLPDEKIGRPGAEAPQPHGAIRLFRTGTR